MSTPRRRRWGFCIKALAVVLAYTMIDPLPRTTSAQVPEGLSCTGGFCLSPNLTNLLGLPNGTLGIRTFRPWDNVIKDNDVAGIPGERIRRAWAPLESEARAALTALHGVPNDERLAYEGISDVRSYIFMRLLDLAKKRHEGRLLTSAEQDALNTFEDIVVSRRLQAAQKAIDEYRRWEQVKCGYTVPPGLGFIEYDGGSTCRQHGTVIGGGPRPLTAKQFTAYGRALTARTFTSADEQAAFRQTDEALAIGVAVGSAVVVSGVAAILAATSLPVAVAFAGMAGTGFIAAAATSAWSGAFSGAFVPTTFAAVTGAGIVSAASLPAIVILGAVTVVIGSIQFAEDTSVLPDLEHANGIAGVTPDLWTTASDPAGMTEMFAEFLPQTFLGNQAKPPAGPIPAPSQRAPGDPQFEVAGFLQDTMTSTTPERKLQETFMSQGWFVTRTYNGTFWGPWEWKLTLRYLGALASPHAVGIQPNGFFDVTLPTSGPAPPAVKVTEIKVFDGFSDRVVRWRGNRPPVLAPTVSEAPAVGQPVRFKANVSDPDGRPIQTLKWFFETGNINLQQSQSLAECSLRPPGQMNTATTPHTPYVCPWTAIIDNGDAGVSHTYTRVGTYAVMVMAEDDEGGISEERIHVTVGALAPTLVVNPLPFTAVAEGASVSITGSIDYPLLSANSTSAISTLVVEWGDGQVTKRNYPCSTVSDIPSDLTCILSVSDGTYARFPLGLALPAGPWSFNLTHNYVFSPTAPLAGIPQAVPHNSTDALARIRVYATTQSGFWSQVELISFHVANVPPTVEIAPGIRDGLIDHALEIRGRIIDAPSASHAVTVQWGDGTSSVYPPGCGGPDCPAPGSAWTGASVPPAGLDAKYLALAHTYTTPGNYQITIEADDGGPGGRASATTNAVMYGVGPILGPAEVVAGEHVTLSYAANLPAGTTLNPTPTCENGELMGTTATSFTCKFAPVTTPTVRHANLNARIMFNEVTWAAFTRSAEITVTPPPFSMSEMTGSTTVTAGTTATYTYSISHLPPGPNFHTPGCGAYGDVIGGSAGSHLVCRFRDVTQPTTTNVSSTFLGLGSTALTVTVLPDDAAPALTLPPTIQVNSTSNAGGTVTFNVSATDVVSGPATVTCTPASGLLFAIGTTMVSCSASDWKGNRSSGSFDVVVKDATPPTLTLPVSFTVDATTPSGAVVTFTPLPSAQDAAPAAPAVSCVPASGGTFAIGTKTVVCSVSDAANNATTGRFTVTVRGATGQLDSLQTYVKGASIHSSVKTPLVAVLEAARLLAKAGRTKQAASVLSVVPAIVKAAGARLKPDQAATIATDTTRIRAVLGG